MRELIRDGAIGKIEAASAWGNRQIRRPGFPAAGGTPPSDFHFDQWIGPSPYHPYSPQYFGGSSGLNCLFWNMYRDFGVGQMGDMGAHTMDLVWNVVDAGAPSGIDIDWDLSDKYDPNICPVKLKAIFDHPANSWRGPVKLVWYQGGLKPDAPKGYLDLSKVGNGAIFEGTKGSIFADFTSRVIIPNNDDGDFTYYKRRGKEDLLPLIMGSGQPTQGQSQQPARRPAQTPAAPANGPRLPGGMAAMPSAEVGANGFPAIQMMEGNIPPAIGMPNSSVDAIAAAEKAGQPIPGRPDVFQLDWIEACKGNRNGIVHGTSSKTHCDFDYAGSMMEQMLLGLVAHRAGKKLDYDQATGRVTNMPEANDWLKRTYRGGWKLDG